MASDTKRGRSGSEPIEISDASESGQVHAPPPSKKRRTTQPDAPGRVCDELGEGEFADVSSNANSQHTSSAAPSPRPGQAGWNEGVKPSGLRTSFGSAITSAAPRAVTVPISREPERPATSAAMVPTKAESSIQDATSSGKMAQSLNVNGLRWVLPAPPGPGWSSDSSATWQFKFERWCQDFIAVNNDQKHITHLRDPKKANHVLRDTFGRWHGIADTKQKIEAKDAAARYGKHKKFPTLINTIVRNLNQGLSMSPMPILVSDDDEYVAAHDGRHDAPHVPVTRSMARAAAGEVAPALFSDESQQMSAKAPIPQTTGETPGAEPPMSKKALKRQRKAARAEAAALAAGEIVPPKPLTKAQRRAAKAAAATQSQASEADASAATSAPKPNVAQTVTSSEPALQGNIAGNSQFAASPVGGRTDDVTMSFDAKAVQRVEELAQEDALEGVQSGKPPDHAAESHADSEMENTADLAAYLDRYFPGVTPDQEFCTGCASYGHRLRSCPRLKCQFCGDTEHMGPGCPTRKRCPKCKQLGHPKEKCTEKLALAPGEAMECAFCASKDHTESDCTEFYRSYRPNEYTMRKVKEIPIYCYCCGKKGHYGTECGLSQVPFVKTRSVETWSMENWRLYVDPNSPNYSIELDPASGSGYVADANGRPDFGKSIVPRTHIIFEDDDDDEEEGFLRPPVQREQQQKNGQIKVGRQGHGGFSSLSRQAHNPPLPPGPPPGLPARPPQQSGQASGGVRKRPKKPKPFQQSKQGQGQGQQNGHGGGGGGFSIRGRAGGRGRGGRR